MRIKNEDLDMLISLGNELMHHEEFDQYTANLIRLIGKLKKQREQNRARTAKNIAERRKVDKNYARSVKH